MGSPFIEERHFTSLHTLQESGESIRRHQISSELDLHQFARQMVHDLVPSIVDVGFLWESAPDPSVPSHGTDADPSTSGNIVNI